MVGIVPTGGDYHDIVELTGRQVTLIRKPLNLDWVNGTEQIEIRTYPIVCRSAILGSVST